jgi:GrpB-like predicted nucleotidyltransferase (UPF0157 family)
VTRGAIADCADLVGVPTWRLDRQRRKGKHALWFYKPAPAAPDERTCHLHLTEPGSDLWRERQAFHDALRADPQLARQYHELKRQLGRSAVGLSDYTAGKRSFVASVLANAGIELPPTQGSSSHGIST